MRVESSINRPHTAQSETGGPWELAPSGLLRLKAYEGLVRCTSEPPPTGFPPAPKRTAPMASSLVETVIPVDRGANALSMSLPRPLHSVYTASAKVSATPRNTSPVSSDLSSDSALSSPTTPSHSIVSHEPQFVADSDQLAQFAKRTAHGGRH
ncbi:hypothetical protein FRC09_003800, partial [Ceratobasidium sp. 395]